uniref:Uncharacterized protein n=1 Tax=Avena sativa TaxID=4498 RepID=A0ACD6AGV2_AVESA
MEAAAPLPKKRKSGVPGSIEPEKISSRKPPPPAATEAPDSHIQLLPPGAEGAEEGVDRISGLPDAILGDIISLLPTREGARTQTLASRWRHLWRSAPLNLDYRDLPAEGDVLIALMSRILSAHAGSGRRLCISAHHLCHEPATVDAWLRSVALSNHQELEFYCAANRPPVLPPVVPSTFRLSSSLRAVTIGQCRLPDGISDTLHFPQLKQLTLENVSISESSLHRVIAGCPVLECMLLDSSFGFSCVRICSPTLRTIGVRLGYFRQGGPQFWKIVIEDAPCLERLLQLDLIRRLDISIISAPNLEIMGCLSFKGFHFSYFQGSRAVFPTVVYTIKTLFIYVDSNSVDMVLTFMSCFPCLEKLYIQQNDRAEKTSWRRKHKSHIRSLDIRLKTVVLKNYRNYMADVDFAMFFVLHAKMLELLRFEVRFCSNGFVASQWRLLQLEKRASRGARFEFTEYTHRRKLEDIKHVQDLSVADPFEW